MVVANSRSRLAADRCCFRYRRRRRYSCIFFLPPIVVVPVQVRPCGLNIYPAITAAVTAVTVGAGAVAANIVRMRLIVVYRFVEGRDVESQGGV